MISHDFYMNLCAFLYDYHYHYDHYDYHHYYYSYPNLPAGKPRHRAWDRVFMDACFYVSIYPSIHRSISPSIHLYIYFLCIYRFMYPCSYLFYEQQAIASQQIKHRRNTDEIIVNGLRRHRKTESVCCGVLDCMYVCMCVMVVIKFIELPLCEARGIHFMDAFRPRSKWKSRKA